MNTRASKRSTSDDSRNPLRLAGIVQHVLDHVGPGHWYFISTVSKLFKDCYERVETDVLLTDGYRSGLHADVITCVPQMTLYSSIFSSSSRVSLTHAS
eukprot:18804-Heterococcus_DN1.PRE.1